MKKPLCDVYMCRDRAYRRIWFELNTFFMGRRYTVGLNFCGTHLKRQEGLVKGAQIVGSMHIDDWRVSQFD